MCITEKYKNSPYSRAEAEYTFGLQKKFIPLIMQNDYKPDGWLGILIGTRIRFKSYMHANFCAFFKI
jgi:hypothetical protein